MEDIKISVLMPIYNPPIIFLKKAIESVLNQTYQNLELILILDGASEEIEKTCEKYKGKDSRIRIYKQTNLGEGYSRNRAIKLAKYEYIMFVDSDDYIDTNILEKLAEKVKREKEKADIIIFDSIIKYEKKKIKNAFYNKEGILNKEDIEEIQLQNIGKGESNYYPNECNVSVVWAKLYRKKFILERNLKFIEGIKRMPDTIFNMYAFEEADCISHYNLYGYYYRKNQNSITNKFDRNIEKDINRFLEEINKYIEKYKKNKRFKNIFDITVLEMASRKIENDLICLDEKEILKWIEVFWQNEKYSRSLNNLKSMKGKLSIYKRMFLYYFKKKNVKALKKIFILKKKMKMLGNKVPQNVEYKIESLVSIMNLKERKDVEEFISNANITQNVLVVNQVEKDKHLIRYEAENKRIYSFKEKGTSKSRNKALQLANADICILADDDVRYVDNYEEIILRAYKKYKKADIIIFSIESDNKKREIKKIRKRKNILDRYNESKNRWNYV